MKTVPEEVLERLLDTDRTINERARRMLVFIHLYRRLHPYGLPPTHPVIVTHFRLSSLNQSYRSAEYLRQHGLLISSHRWMGRNMIPTRLGDEVAQQLIERGIQEWPESEEIT